MNTQLSPVEQQSLMTIALMGAFADGGKSEVERAEVKRIAQSFSSPDLNTAALYQAVLLKQVTLPAVCLELSSPAARQLAYEMALCVAEADGLLNEQEKTFLGELRQTLQLDTAAVAPVKQTADELIEAPVAAGAIPPVITDRSSHDQQIDSMVLKYAILNGALELLPDSLATMAIVPLQMKLVYGVGAVYGHTLDRRHITELLGAAGIGLSSQVLEGFARKLVGGFLGKMTGGLGRGIGNQMVSSGMSFASTYALGQLAKRYYSGGRQLSAFQLRETFSSLTEQAKTLHGRYAGEIQERARSINPSQLLSLVRGANS